MTIREELVTYSKACINDDKHCCRKHRQACKRFLRDLEREGTDEFPFYFDEKKANRFFEWSKLHKHTKGVLVGKSIEFTPIQRFIFGNIFGWVDKEGLRRFKKAYWQVGRKNAKSQSLAIVGDYMLMADGEPMAEVYIGATKNLQAKIIYNEVVAMLRRSPEYFKGKWAESYSIIQHPKSDSILRALSKDDGKTGDGLNPSCGLIDEYHAHATDEIMEVIKTGMIARKQPLLFIITTAGSNFGGPCYRVEYPLIEKILDDNVDFDVPDYFAMVNELDRDSEGNLLDDVNDPECWIKANPIACSYAEGVANIKSNLLSAIESPEKMESFLTKNMNLWVNQSAASYMDMSKWNSRGLIAKDKYTLDGLNAYVGIDLSSKIDLTSIGLVIPIDIHGVQQYVVIGHSFIPEETLNTKERTDKVPYRMWAQLGHLTVTPGEVVDYRFMTEWLKRTALQLGLNIVEICYDPYNATHYAQELEADGYTCLEVRQGVATLSEPTKTFRELAYEGRILHMDNPLLDFAVSNAVTKVDAQGNIMLDKAKAVERIDPIASIINAFTRALVNQTDDISGYINSDDFSF